MTRSSQCFYLRCKLLGVTSRWSNSSNQALLRTLQLTVMHFYIIEINIVSHGQNKRGAQLTTIQGATTTSIFSETFSGPIRYKNFGVFEIIFWSIVWNKLNWFISVIQYQGPLMRGKPEGLPLLKPRHYHTNLVHTSLVPVLCLEQSPGEP